MFLIDSTQDLGIPYDNIRESLAVLGQVFSEASCRDREVCKTKPVPRNDCSFQQISFNRQGNRTDALFFYSSSLIIVKTKGSFLMMCL